MSLTLPSGAAVDNRGASSGTRWHRRVLTGLAAQSGNGLIYLVFLVLIGLPLSTVLLQSVLPWLFDPVHPSFRFDASALLRAFSTPRVAVSILHSLELGGTVAITATVLGGGFAVLTQRFSLPLRRLVAPVPWLVFLTPSYLKALAWVLLMAPQGYLAQLGLLPRAASDAFFGLGGLVFVHTIGLFPLASFIIGGALAGLGTDLEDAARLAGARPWRIWLKVTLPLLAPAIALSCIATFAEVLSDFGLAATIARQSHFGLLTYGIYVAASDYPIDFPMAGAQAFILLLLILTVVFADRLLRRQTEARLISGRARGTRVSDAGRWRWSAATLGLLVAILALYLPMTAIVLRAFTATLGYGLETANFTLAHLAAAISPGTDAGAALLRSLVYAGITAVIGTSVALLLAARVDAASKSVRAAVVGLSLGTVAIPGIVLGFGYILVWNRLPGFVDWPFPHYGDASLLVTGYVATAMPYCLVVILSAVGQLAPSLGDAARLHGHGRLTRLLRITLPLVLLSVVTAFLLTFIRTMFELPVSQLLIPQVGSPLPPFVVRLANHDEDGAAAALSLVSMVAAGGIAGLVWTLVKRRITFGGALKGTR
ncbi:MAG: ABC transporter permease subunit [Rhodobacteraceae bacterium]|nr:ABC transporter permease subunit [Paracoccaceae bacterium]